MTEDSPNNSANNPNDITPVNSIKSNDPTNYMIEGKHNEPEKTDNNNTKCSSQQPFIVKIEQNNGWKRAEIISIFAILISACLFYMTLRTFNKTRRAVEISEENLKDSREKDSIAKSNFELENAPFVECNNVIINIPKPMQPLGITYQIFNYGNYPVMLENVKVIFWSVKGNNKIFVNDTKEEDYFNTDTINISNYVIKEHPFKGYFVSNAILNKEQVDSIKNNTLRFGIYGEVKYQHLLNNKKMVYYFKIFINDINSNSFNVIYSYSEIDKFHK
jgi:hypothetical protein